MDEAMLKSQIGSKLSVRGGAFDAMAGAVVLTDDRTPVYIRGLPHWSPDLRGNDVIATGSLCYDWLVPKAEVATDGSVSHGIEDKVFFLESATWTAAE